MSSYTFKSIIQDEELIFNSKLFLWIWHADKIPPHIGISHDESYFSLKVSGKDSNLDCSKTLAMANSKRIPLVLVELKNQVNLENISSEFNQYQQAEVGFTTCLTPISRILNHPKASQLSELLTLCEQENEILNFYGANLPKDYSSLESYSNDDIQKRLQLLTNENRKISIS